MFTLLASGDLTVGHQCQVEKGEETEAAVEDWQEALSDSFDIDSVPSGLGGW